METTSGSTPVEIPIVQVKIPEPDIKFVYDEQKDLINIITPEGKTYSVTPYYLTTLFDKSLLMKLYRIRLNKMASMEKYIEDNLELAKKLSVATDRFEVYKLTAIKNVMKEVRHAVRLSELEETKVKEEILEKEAGIRHG